MEAKKSTLNGQSKAAFVRSLPPGTPAREVVAKAKAEGIPLDVGYVYNVRSTSNASAKKKGAAVRAPSHPADGAAHKASHGASAAEALLRAIGAELGLGRSIQILETERARVKSVLAS